MKQKQFKISYFLLFLIFITFPLQISGISLQEAQELALKQNRNYLAQKQNLEEAKWNEYKAISNFLPKLSFEESMVRIDEDSYEAAQEIYQLPVLDSLGLPTGDYVPMSYSALGSAAYRTTFTSQLSLQQPIFNGGKLILGYKIADLAHEQAKSSLLSEKFNLEYKVSELYFNILRIEDLITIHKKQLNSSLNQYNKVKKKHELGMAKKTDLLQWKVKVENNRIKLDEVENNLEILKSYWQNILGLNQAKNKSFPEKIDLQKFEQDIKDNAKLEHTTKKLKLKNVLAKVQKKNADLKKIELASKISKKSYDLAKGNFLPSLNLQYTRQFEQDDKLNFKGEDNWNIAAVFSLPLFESGRNITEVLRAKSSYKKANLKLSDTREHVLIATKNAFYNLLTKAKKVESSKTSLHNAQENHTMINDYYEQGLVTNQELLDAEIMMFSAKMQLTNAYYDFIIAKYNLNKFLNE